MSMGGGSSPAPAPASSQTVRQVNDLPEYFQPYMERLFQRAESTTTEPYQTYTAPRLEPFTPAQQQAFEGYRQQVGASQPYMQAATGLTTQAATQFPDVDISQYMNPYQQNVTDIATREAQRINEMQQQGIRAAAVKAGAFGGTRGQFALGESQRNLNQQLADIQMRGSQAAYETGRQAFEQDRAAALAAGKQFGSIGGLQQALTSQELGGLEAVGEKQRATGQQALDIAYEDFARQIEFPYRQVERMGAALRGYNIPQSSYSTTASYQAQPGVAQQIAGAGIGGLAMYKMLGYKRGGLIHTPGVRNFKCGGLASTKHAKKFADGGRTTLSDLQRRAAVGSFYEPRDPNPQAQVADYIEEELPALEGGLYSVPEYTQTPGKSLRYIRSVDGAPARFVYGVPQAAPPSNVGLQALDQEPRRYVPFPQVPGGAHAPAAVIETPNGDLDVGVDTGLGLSELAMPKLRERSAEELADLKNARLERQWMPLAQFGFGLMASNKPTLGAAIGEEAQRGLKTRSEYNKIIRETEAEQAKADYLAAMSQHALAKAGTDIMETPSNITYKKALAKQAEAAALKAGQDELLPSMVVEGPKGTALIAAKRADGQIKWMDMGVPISALAKSQQMDQKALNDLALKVAADPLALKGLPPDIQNAVLARVKGLFGGQAPANISVDQGGGYQGKYK